MNTCIDTLNRGIGVICRLVLYITLSATFFILSANVVLRYASGTSLAWASELPELMFPWIIMSGVVLAAQHGSHIAVVLLTQRLGAARRWVLAGGAIAVAALYLGLTWATLPLLEIAADERTPILNVPGSITVVCLMAGFVLLAVVTLLQLPALWRQACDGEASDPRTDLQGASA